MENESREVTTVKTVKVKNLLAAMSFTAVIEQGAMQFM